MEKIKIDPQNFVEKEVKTAVRVLGEGGVIAFPTETVYGLAARADKEFSFKKLSSIKGRPEGKPFSLALADAWDAAENYFATLAPFGYRLIENFWPGPLTLVYYCREKEGKVGLRVPSDSVARNILQQLDFPIFLTSANKSDEKEVVSPLEIEKVFAGKIDLIIDAGDLRPQRPSTVLDLTCKPFNILREGGISENQIASIFIRRRILFVCTGNSCRSPMAEYLLRYFLKKNKKAASQRYEVVSAGISAFDGAGPAAEVEKIMQKEEGIDISQSKANLINKQMILSSDYIFAMEDSQIEFILKMVPSAEARIFHLKKFLPFDPGNIPDPIGRGYDFYKNIYQLIRKAVSELTDWI